MGLSGDSINHEYFEQLAALLELGELSRGEYSDLQKHLQECASCRAEHAAFADILLNQLPLAHPERLATYPDIVGSPTAEKIGWFSLLTQPVPVYAPVLALLVLSMGFVGYRHHVIAKLNEVHVATQEHVGKQATEGVTSQSSQAEPRTDSDSEQATDARKAMTGALIEARDYGKIVNRARFLEEKLHDATSQNDALKRELEKLGQQDAELSAKLEDANKSFARISSELEVSHTLHSQDEATLLAKDVEVAESRRELSSAKESFTRTQSFLTADRDIRNLMGARNLRIVDIFDVDGKGKTKRAFGRVFFTEGKSLIFYAFDLEKSKPSIVPASYQAWGYQGSVQNEVRNLGIFYQDDQKANRWVLKFDDPNVLAEIDSVFVTLEPAGGSKKPTGGKLLPAYLKASLNHP